MGNLLFQLLAVFAEFEREIIRERTLRALEVKRKRELMGGRPKVSKLKINRAFEDYDSMKMSIGEILSTYDLSRSTFYRYLKNRKKTNQ